MRPLRPQKNIKINRKEQILEAWVGLQHSISSTTAVVVVGSRFFCATPDLFSEDERYFIVVIIPPIIIGLCRLAPLAPILHYD